MIAVIPILLLVLLIMLFNAWGKNAAQAGFIQRLTSTHRVEQLKYREEISQIVESLGKDIENARKNSDFWKERTEYYSYLLVEEQHKSLRQEERIHELEAQEILLRKTLCEAPLGFPTLLEALKQYDSKNDERLAYWLESKSHPAYTSAQIVREETRKRREAEYSNRQAHMLLEYYFSVYPDAKEARDMLQERQSEIETPSEDTNEDAVNRYLSREEYQKLSTTERNQLALDRFWNMKKSKLLIGRLYEQYVGYLYEKNGWGVEYYGITEGFSDLGRDLICHKGGTTLLVQCKNWSKSKKIYEKHIFQLFGTTYEYAKNNPFINVRGVFFTSTSLSDLARTFAKEFGIEIHEQFGLQKFPIIKCNIGREGEWIYHLPFDQQYYTTKINPKDGDFYCATVKEAEERGFRRAYRWHGDRD